jgi:hypothetical protein
MSDDISSNRHDEDIRIVDSHVNQLAEHFDTVHIFVSKLDGANDRTLIVNRGAGNWSTRFGQISEWLIYEDERIRAQARKRLGEDT